MTSRNQIGVPISVMTDSSDSTFKEQTEVKHESFSRPFERMPTEGLKLTEKR